jgi:hypothetical protein
LIGHEGYDGSVSARAPIVLLRADGHSVADIVGILGTTKPTVYKCRALAFSLACPVRGDLVMAGAPNANEHGRRQPSARDVTSWMTCHPDSLDEDRAKRLKEALARCPALDRTAQHARAFAWIAHVLANSIPALHTFAVGLGQDLDAVIAGLSLCCSSGAVEGHNNKIKMLKRQMFDRTNFDLLHKRVLRAAWT